MDRLRRRRLTGDDGLGLVLVLGMGAILTGLMILSTSTAIRSLASSREHVSFESALATADGGIEIGLARTQRTYVATGSDSHAIPGPANAVGECLAAPILWPWPTSQPTPAQERNWARSQLELLAATGTTGGCLKSARGGEYAILKPVGRQVIYALAWSPRRGASEVKQRLIKAEYLFTPYAPLHAILAGGDLVLDASTMVTSAPPNDPALAAVHSNGNLSVSSGNPTVFGPVTQSGAGTPPTSNNFQANPGNQVLGAAKERIPFDGARVVWTLNRTKPVPGGWYDLCPNGTVQAPTGATPCAGSLLTDLSGGGSFRGWSYTLPAPGAVPIWSAGDEVKQNGFSGTYYISEGDVVNPASNSGPRVPALTVLASARTPATPTTPVCDKVGGNIRWGSTDPAAPSIPNTWLIADQDLVTESSYSAGSAVAGTVVSGFFLAGDQMDMSTSSNGAYGAVIALDQCSPTSSLVDLSRIKNPSIYYDPNAQAPFTDIINNTLWLEYPS